MSDDGFVYFIQGQDDGPIKIGFTRDVAGRLRQLQTGHHDRLRVLRSMRGDKALEAWLHRRFAAHRLTGEWFTPHRDLLRYIIDNTLADDERARASRRKEIEARTAAYTPPQPAMAPTDLAQQARTLREMLAARKARHEELARKAAAERAAVAVTLSHAGAALHTAALRHAATSGWLSPHALAGLGRVHDPRAFLELEAHGVLSRDASGVYVHPLRTIERAAMLASGAVP